MMAKLEINTTKNSMARFLLMADCIAMIFSTCLMKALSSSGSQVLAAFPARHIFPSDVSCNLVSSSHYSNHNLSMSSLTGKFFIESSFIGVKLPPSRGKSP